MRSRSVRTAILNKSLLFSGRIIILTGAKQTGNTTLARRTFQDLKYIAVDDPVKINQYTCERERVFQYYIKNGGYPVLTKNKMDDDERYKWLTNYIRTYLERDVRDLADLRSLEPFVRIQRMTALMKGISEVWEPFSINLFFCHSF